MEISGVYPMYGTSDYDSIHSGYGRVLILTATSRGRDVRHAPLAQQTEILR